MRHSQLLELIWQGDIQLASGLGARRLQRTLGALLPLRTVSLVATSGVDIGHILTDDTELLPELPLGDVLVEELSIDVPMGSLVVISNADLLSRPMKDDEFSHDLGILVAEALVGVVRSGVFPLSRETDALYAMACSYHAMIGGAAFGLLGVVPASFRAGLAAGLCSYWTGVRSARRGASSLLLRSDFPTCLRLHDYLLNMDGNFTAPEQISAGLMHFTGGPCSHEAWLLKVEKAVMAELDAHVSRTCDGGSPHELRA